MATYTAAKAERDRLMAYVPGLQSMLRHVTGTDYELRIRDARQTHAKTPTLDESWLDTTVASTQSVFP